MKGVIQNVLVLSLCPIWGPLAVILIVTRLIGVLAWTTCRTVECWLWE